MEWGTLAIDRAEPKMPDGNRPDDVFARQEHGIITAWPTKLALSPRLARNIIDLLELDQITPATGGTPPGLPVPEELSHPGYAALPWQDESNWH